MVGDLMHGIFQKVWNYKMSERMVAGILLFIGIGTQVVGCWAQYCIDLGSKRREHGRDVNEHLPR